MKGFNKFVVVCYCLITIALFLIIIAVALGAIPSIDVMYLLESMEKSMAIRVFVCVIAFALLLAGMISITGNGKRSANSYETQKIKECTFGTVSITVLAIEEIAKRYFDEVKEVRTINLSTATTKIGISITARLTLAPQIVIPDITEKIQLGLKECLENFTGIIIENVNVVVCDSTTTK